MRLLFDHQIFGLQSRGGISRYVLELGSSLRRRNDVTVHLEAGFHRSVALREQMPPWARGHYLAPLPRTTRLRQWLNGFLCVHKIKTWMPDVVHETFYRSGRTYRASIPTVLTVHDMLEFRFPAGGSVGDRTRHAQMAAIRRADEIICVSEATRQELACFAAIDPDRVTVVHHGAPSAHHTHGALWDPLPEPTVLYVGLRGGYKDFDTLLRSIALLQAKVPALQLAAFGGGALTADEWRRIDQLGIERTQISHRSGSDSELWSAYERASAFVCPSRSEGFGMPVLEAMSAGCPVICSRGGALPEVAGDAAAYFETGDPQSLASVIELVVTRRESRAQLRELGLKRAAVFSWDRCASETLSVYRRAIERHQS